MRKLASVQRVVEINEIPGADRIVCIQVLGWWCVTQKSNNFKVNDLVVYLEIDSMVPYADWSSFLFETPSGRQKIRTRKFKGQVSQGLILPIDILKDEIDPEAIVEGLDVTELLEIEKYEPNIPANLQGVIKSTFPSWIPKTDEERIQSWPWILNELKGRVLVGTEKLDGSSMTTYIKDGEFGVCSRNLDLKESEGNSFWKMARELDLENKLKSVGQNIAIQGELVGPGVQGNKYHLETLTFRAFNAFDIDLHQHLGHKELEDLCVKLDIPLAPMLALIEVDDIVTVDYLVKLVSQCTSALNTKTPIEGMVFRPLTPMIHPKYGRVSFKVINPEFLLKYGE